MADLAIRCAGVVESQRCLPGASLPLSCKISFMGGNGNAMRRVWENSRGHLRPLGPIILPLASPPSNAGPFPKRKIKTILFFSTQGIVLRYDIVGHFPAAPVYGVPVLRSNLTLGVVYRSGREQLTGLLVNNSMNSDVSPAARSEERVRIGTYRILFTVNNKQLFLQLKKIDRIMVEYYVEEN